MGELNLTEIHKLIAANETLKDDEVEVIFRGQRLLFDKQDIGLFATLPWYTLNRDGKSYLVRNVHINGRHTTSRFHREIMAPIPDDLEVDHINGDGLDNRRRNLRLVTHKQNQNNQKLRQEGSSKYRYVSYRADMDKWIVYIFHDGKTRNIGAFKSEEEAALRANQYIVENNLNKRLNIL